MADLFDNEQPVNEEKSIEERQKEIINKINARPKFQFKEDTSEGKEVYTIYGNKGDGKTTLALSFPGTIAALSFDHKTAIVKNNFYKKEDRIKVFNAVEFYDENFERVGEASSITFEYIMFLLRKIETDIKPDWILIDGLEIVGKIGEGVMRYNNKLKPTQGIANMGIWKERRAVLKSIHRASLEAANKGVIYTTYSDKDEIIEDGVILRKKDAPKYLDVVLYETDVVIHVECKREGQNLKHFAEIVSSKFSKLKTGNVIDVTNRGLFDTKK